MYERTAIYLIHKSPDPRGVTDPVEETRQMVYATVRSVGHTELYEAMTHGLRPSLIFRLANYLDYDGSLYCEYNGRRYRVIRTYRTGMTIDLTVEEANDVV